ncbi:MAG: lactonase family protein, partial [Phycisphaeraceae bacterium]
MPRPVMKTVSRWCLLVALLFAVGCAATPTQRQSLYVSCRGGERVIVYEIDRETGALAEVQRVKLPGQPGPIALTEDGNHLYAALRSPSRVLPMTRDTKTGELALLEPTNVPAFPTYLDIDANANYALTANYSKGIVHSFRLNDDRTLAPNPIQATETDKTAHACLIDPSNRFVYIPHTIPNAIYQFRFD